MDLDEVAAELYDAAPEDFTRLRKEQIDAARAAGERELAKQINQLRRPTRSAWIVNLLAGQAADEVSGLLDLGAALADAQQRLSGKELRELSSQRHSVISSLVKRGSQLAQVRGHTPTEATLREVSDTLQAALSDPQIAEQVRSGRLATAQEYGGFGPELLLSMSAPPAAKQKSADQAERDEDGHEGRDRDDTDRADDDHADDDSADDDHQGADRADGTAEDDHEDVEHQRLVQELNTAQVALDRIRGKAAGTAERLEKANEAVAYRTERVQDLQDQLQRAERELAKAKEQLDKLTGQQDELRDAEKAAEQAVSTALSRLADG